MTKEKMVGVNPTILDDLLWWSFRYGLGRQSYVVGEITRTLRIFATQIGPSHRALMIKEIDEAIERGRAGMDCDVREWRAVRVALEAVP